MYLSMAYISSSLIVSAAVCLQLRESTHLLVVSFYYSAAQSPPEQHYSTGTEPSLVHCAFVIIGWQPIF
jgi:hypothetical protein